MNNINIPPFYVGEEVEAIETHSQGAFNKGDKFTITSISEGCCEWNVTIGISNNTMYSRCPECGAHSIQKGEWIFKASRFRSLQTNFQQITYKAVLEETQPMICIN